MLKKIKDRIRILFDPTMFKYNHEFMEYISVKPCMKCYGNMLNNDLIILFDDKCQHCGYTDECRLNDNKFNLENVICKLYDSMAHIKNLGFNYNIIYAFYVNPKNYNSYNDFYNEILMRFDKLFIADYIILYGLKKHKIKVLKCNDNIDMGIKTKPIFTKESNCIIKEIN